MAESPAARRDRPGADPGDGRFDLAARATLLVWLLDPPLGWPAAVPALALAGAGVLWPGVLRSPLLWAGLAAVAVGRVGLDWMLADNHHYLMALWCLALALSRFDPSPGEAAAANARRLVGLAFAFAVLWKAVLSPDFADGRFFRVTFLVDSRFEPVAVALGGLDADAIRANDATLARFDPALPATSDAASPRLLEPPALRGAALAATAWTLFIEAAVAVAFLWPRRRRGARSDPTPARRAWPGWLGADWLGDAALLSFCWTTYAVAPVAGFGWLLAALGLAHTPFRRARWLYAATFLLILVHHRLPWLETLVGPPAGV